MLKVMAFLVARDDIGRRDLIDHYEHHHVPLILAVAGPPAAYVRNYVRRSENASRGDDVDIITELTFADEPAYRAWVGRAYAPDSGVAEDEARFLDRSRSRSYVVDEAS